MLISCVFVWLLFIGFDILLLFSVGFSELGAIIGDKTDIPPGIYQILSCPEILSVPWHMPACNVIEHL